MQATTSNSEASAFTKHSISLISDKITKLIGNTCKLSKKGISNTYNISGLQEIVDRLQIIEDSETLTISNDTVRSYTVAVLGPQGTVVPVTKYLPSITGPIKKALEAIIYGQFQEYKKLEVDKLIGAAALEILLSLQDTFAFLEDYNSRDTRFMRATMSENATKLIRSYANEQELYTATIDNAKVGYDRLTTNDISTNCKDTILRMTITTLVNDIRTCWFRPAQVHASAEIRHKDQQHPRDRFIYYLGDNNIRAGRSLLAQAPYIRISSKITSPIYLRNIDAFLWTSSVGRGFHAYKCFYNR